MRPIAKVRGVILTLALAMTAGAWPAVSAAAEATDGPPCGAMEPLTAPAGARSASVADADPTGRFQVGRMEDGSFTGHLLRWVDGTPQDLGTAHADGRAINASGDIAGIDDTAWRYHDGQFTDLPTEPPGAEAVPTGINAEGTISGFVRDPSSGTPLPVIWSQDNVMHLLSLPPGDGFGIAEDIDDDGTVVGKTASPTATEFRPVLWHPDGTVEALPQLQPGPNTGVEDLTIRDGWVAATEFYDSSDMLPQVLRWSAGATQPEPVGQGSAEAINTHGSVVMIGSPDSKLRILQDGVLRSLPSDDEPAPTARVTALTDDHIAYGFWHSTPMLWDCRPTP